MEKRRITHEAYLDAVTGAMIGKAIAGNIGAPFEGDKIEMAIPFTESLIDPTRPNDDLDLQVLWLDVVEEKGADFTSRDLLERFLDCCDYSPGEYAVMRKNGEKKIWPPYSGAFCNDIYREGMGCPIRADIWGALAVGNPALASDFAYRDGTLDHAGESVIAEQFIAMLEAESFFEKDLEKLIDLTLPKIPAESKFAGMVKFIVSLTKECDSVSAIRQKILFRYGNPDCTNMFQNVGITLAALLLGKGEVIPTVMMCLNSGFDTDCTTGIAGAVLGFLQGAEKTKKAYGVDDSVCYGLGVRSKARSGLIVDLASEIVSVGETFVSTGVNPCAAIENAPESALAFKAPEKIRITFLYDGDPSIAPGEHKSGCVKIENRSDAEEALSLTLTTKSEVEAALLETRVNVPPHGEAAVKASFSLAKETELVPDCFFFTVKAASRGGAVFRYDFGYSGAVPYKLSGPFWTVDPIITTEEMISNITEKRPYRAFVGRSKYSNLLYDKKRYYHLAFAPDLDTEFMTEDELFAPAVERYFAQPSPKGPIYTHEEQCVAVPEDVIRISDHMGFVGGCTCYYSRIIRCEEECETAIYLGTSCPVKLVLNGETIAEARRQDYRTFENHHIAGVRLKKGDNRLVLRMTRIGALDAEANVTFVTSILGGKPITGITSVNPLCW